MGPLTPILTPGEINAWLDAAEMLIRIESRRLGWLLREVTSSRVSKSRYLKLRHKDGRVLSIRLSDHHKSHPLTITCKRPDLLKKLISQLRGDVTPPRPSKSEYLLLRLVTDIACPTKLHQSNLPPVDLNEPRMIPAANAAEKLGITVPTLRNWNAKGWIKGAEKIGGRVHYPLESVELAASQHPKGPKAQKVSP